ncbi:unnamed protein product, partial [Phaeothamnion confervicola]
MAAGAILARYSTIFVIVPAAAFVLSRPAVARPPLAHMAASLAVAGVLLVPHAVWFFDSRGQPLIYLAARGSEFEAAGALLAHLVIFVFAQAAMLAPAAVVLVLAVRFAAPVTGVHLLGSRLLDWIALAPVPLLTAGLLAAGGGLRTMYGVEAILLLPAWLCVRLARHWDLRPSRNVFLAAGAFWAIGLIAYVAVQTRPAWLGPIDVRTAFPGRALAAALEREFARASHGRFEVVVGDQWLAGNV